VHWPSQLAPQHHVHVGSSVTDRLLSWLCCLQGRRRGKLVLLPFQLAVLIGEAQLQQ
jgi:hypothetical protein